MNHKQNQGNQTKVIPISPNTNKKNRWLLIAGILVAAGSAFIFWPSGDQPAIENSIPNAPVSTAPVQEIKPDKLVGRWQRSDGGYIIELKNPTLEGLIDASYYNPNPINVGKSAWQNKAGKLMVLVELQDQNYPGSLYNLEYQSHVDKLTGTYFQAVERVSYNVEFVRLQK